MGHADIKVDLSGAVRIRIQSVLIMRLNINWLIWVKSAASQYTAYRHTDKYSNHIPGEEPLFLVAKMIKFEI
jgi:hypothetical protein